MKVPLFLLTILLVNPVLVSSQTEAPNGTQDNNPQNHRSHITITGCLTKNAHNEYELVDEQGVRNLLYSRTVKLDPLVGQSVSLVGDRSATPSTDTGTARPMPHFRVLEARQASGPCNK